MTTETTPAEWALRRAVQLCKGVDLIAAFARYIAEHEPAPADPLLIEAREIVAKGYDNLGFVDQSGLVRAGSYDSSKAIENVMAILKRSMELVKGETK